MKDISADKTMNGPKYWRNLDELMETEGFQEAVAREFPEGAGDLDGMNRRHFMKIMAASFAMAGVGLTGCRRPVHKILPYAKQPENVIPGRAEYYATAFGSAHDATPLIVETHQVRPTKVEGNPAYTAYAGKTGSYAQASILDLYDPDRSQVSRKGSAIMNKAVALDEVSTLRRVALSKKGEGFAILLNRSTSPSRQRLLQQIRKDFPQAMVVDYEPIDQTAPFKAAEKLFGSKVKPVYHFDNAKCVLAIDANFTEGEPGAIRNSLGFAKSRRVMNADEAHKMSRLYCVESDYSVTGTLADHRFRLSNGELAAFAALLLAELVEQSGSENNLTAKLKAQAAPLLQTYKDKELEQWIRECAKDLLSHAKSGKALIVGGSSLPEEVQQILYVANKLVGAYGNTLSMIENTQESGESIYELADKIRAGGISQLLILHSNPVYDAPSDLNWEQLQKSVESVYHYSLYENETTESAHVHFSAAHYLESWGDLRAYDGTYFAVQPMILPLYDGIMELELLAVLAGEKEPEAYAVVKETFAGLRPGKKPEVTEIEELLFLGYLEGSAAQEVKVTPNLNRLGEFVTEAQVAPRSPSKDNLEIRFLPSFHSYDGRYANNGWLQECPDPMTKLTWDNTLLISPKLAEVLDVLPQPLMINKLGQSRIRNNEYVAGKEQAPRVQVKLADGRTIDAWVHIQPGLADYTVIAPLGFGRRKAGRVGTNLGFNAYPLRTSTTLVSVQGARLIVTGGEYMLANTQEHPSMEGRAIVRENNVADYQKDPNWVNKMGAESHSPPIYGKDHNMPLAEKVTQIPVGNSLYQTPKFDAPQQWGMSIDLNTCTGCNACVIACQSENSIPIVGKEQVSRGRIMHWIRLDRYFSSGESDTLKIPEDPQVATMPVACQHCELAPCESVCPVNATVHDSQGLNTMAYNRCVGTRYCANNCPYKVRRFNFFDWNQRQLDKLYMGPLGPKGMPDTLQMQKNPNVTVRMRGVIEKCTYCVQRIEAAKIRQKVAARDSDNIKVPDGVIKVACQQACPADSITFGDVADDTTVVSKAKASDRNYALLGYLNIRPRTTYLGRLRNPNPLMPDFYRMPLSKMEYKKDFKDNNPSI
jgi:MoCo/4Fe-4S cofactor protein with predicted Tat translocation signal